MTVRDYRRSAFFGEDNPRFGSLVAVGVLLLAVCGVIAVPWTLTRARPTFAGPVDVVHFIVAWGAVPIFLLAFRAVSHARSALADLGVNLAIAQHVEKSAAQALQQIRRDPRTRVNVAHLESLHLPDNPDNPKPASLRLFQRICAEAMDRRFESTINLIEPYQRESMESTLRLEAVQRTALRLGILCHFIGLVLVINAVPAMIASSEAPQHVAAQAIAEPGMPAEAIDDTASDEGAIRKVLDGLLLAFGASVGGLSVSVFGAMLLSSVRKKQFAYFRKLDEATATMIALASNSLNNDELLASLQHVSARLQEQTLTVKEGIVTLASAIAEQAKTIEAGLESLGGAKAKLDGFLDGISQSHDEFLKKLNTYYDVGTIAGMARQISKQIDMSQDHAVFALKSEIASVHRDVTGVRDMTSLHLGSGVFRFVPHALVALACASGLTLLFLLLGSR